MKKEVQVRLMKFSKQAGVALGGGVLALPAFATIDTTSITDVITSVVAAAAVVGAAVLAMHYGIKAYKWLRQAG